VVKIEICVQTMRGYPDTLALAQWCERQGIPALAVADHYLSGPGLTGEAFDQLVILGGIARETSTLGLCTLVSPLTFRHPAVHLKAAVTLDQMSEGRFSLGIGAGWMESEHEAFGLELFDVPERMDRLEETLGYLRAAIDGSGAGFEGKHYQLASFPPQPTPTNLRLIVGGGGARRTPRLAGQFGDEFNAFPDQDTDMRTRIGRCQAAAAEAGRVPAAVLLSTAFPAAVAKDAAVAEELIARRAARMDVDLASARTTLDRLEIPHGTPDQAAARYASLSEAGITRVYLQLSGSTLPEVEAAVESARASVELAGV
jgi:alkanesulfonate monooxygenase SsuD/methylene tetrahydromethanopterin reductase-like flavin-dependent oxidoreductase (luciferase family)